MRFLTHVHYQGVIGFEPETFEMQVKVLFHWALNQQRNYITSS